MAPLARRQIRPAIAIVEVGAVRDRTRVVLEEQRSPLAVAAPRQGAMGHRLGEDDRCPRRPGHRSHQAIEIAFELAPVVGERQVRLVAARDAAEAAVAGVDVAQVVGHDHEPGPRSALDERVPLPGVERHRPAVQSGPDRALAPADQVGIVVVEPVARPEEFVEVREDRVVVDEGADLRSPVEHIRKAMGGRFGGHVSCDPLVHERVERVYRLWRQHTRKCDVPVQIEQIALRRVHAVSRLRRRGCGPGPDARAMRKRCRPA